jgi:hypothetical protein
MFVLLRKYSENIDTEKSLNFLNNPPPLFRQWADPPTGVTSSLIRSGCGKYKSATACQIREWDYPNEGGSTAPYILLIKGPVNFKLEVYTGGLNFDICIPRYNLGTRMVNEGS